MDEGLQCHMRPGTDRTDFVDGQFASQNDAFHPQLLGHCDAFRTGQRHLRRGVDRQVRTHGSHQLQHTQVLDQDRVDARLRQRADGLFDHRQLAGKGQRVQRHVPSHAALVQQAHHVRQFFEREIDRTVPGIKADLQTEIHCVRAILDRRQHAITVPRRGQ
jgi:hypothetical protein